MADFGFREGYSTMGSYRTAGGLVFIYVKRGERHNPDPGTVEAWIAANGPLTKVELFDQYEPAYVRNFPVRAMLAGGTVAELPSVEADAIVAAGIARYA